MRPLDSYNVFIFDCDGVIFDSNNLKVDAMEIALLNSSDNSTGIADCLDFFKNNFGISRFNHVNVFINEILMIKETDKQRLYDKILFDYSKQCRDLYLKAELTPGVIELFNKIVGPIYVASGSEEKELVGIMKERGLDVFFEGIYGSPTSKSELVRNILDLNNTKNAVIFGDALSDMNAAISNKIDFVAFLPYSNVPKELESLSKGNGFSVLNSWVLDI